MTTLAREAVIDRSADVDELEITPSDKRAAKLAAARQS